MKKIYVLIIITFFFNILCFSNEKDEKILFDYMKMFNLIKNENDVEITEKKYEFENCYLSSYSSSTYKKELRFKDGSFFYVYFSEKKDILIVRGQDFKSKTEKKIIEKQAFAYIKKYLKIVCPKVPFGDLKLKKINRPRDPIYETFYDNWNFTYIRTYKGYEMNGRFNGSVRATDGAFLGCMRSFSDSTCETVVNISVDEAAKIAKKYMESDECSINIMKKKMFKRNQKNLEVEIVKSPSKENGFKIFPIIDQCDLDLSKPVIVIKNNFLLIDHSKVKGEEEIWGDREKIALVWVLGVKQKKNRVPGGNFLIYIDTKTGEVVGGKFS